MTTEDLKGFIDLTTLSISDTSGKVIDLCQKGIANSVAAICVYPNFVTIAKKALATTNIKVASVAGCFPAAQSSIDVINAEVRFAVDSGADELDIVFPVGLLLEQKISKVKTLLKAIKQSSRGKVIKCILETGALKTENLIRQAAELSIECGADFLKTSTGKITPAATPEAAKIMLEVISKYYKETGNKIGFKAAGGISKYEEALIYIKLVKEILNEEWIAPNFFRIGASSLVDNL